jgi:rRNA maturation RNase YbeY
LNRHLSIHNRQRAVLVDTGYLRRFTRSLLRDLLAAEEYNLGIYLVGSVEMARLNETYLRHRGSTDVLAFDYADKAGPASRWAGSWTQEVRQDAGPPLYGEIFLCTDEAIQQARRFRTDWQSELARYLTHAVLHLRGFDDRQPADRRKMKRAEDRLLKEIARRFPLRKLARRPKLAA